jgi:protein TonB
MKTDQINGMDEIIFEKRNKLYGAYELRTNYARRLNRSFMLSLIVVIMIFVLASMNKPDVKPEILTVSKDSVHFSDFTVEAFKPKTAVHQTQQQKQPQENMYVPVTDSVQDKNEKDTVKQFADDFKPGDTSGNTGTANADTGVIAGSGMTQTEPRTIGQVDKMPEFPGGLEKFYSYLMNRIHYTQSAKEAQVNGKLYVRFIIDEQGLVEGVSLVNSIGYGLDEQVKSVISDSPKWKPGIYHEDAVKTVMVLPVSFTIK